MKLLLIGLDGVRLDIAVPAAMTAHPGFAEPDHPADPRFAAGPRPEDAPDMPEPTDQSAAPTLERLWRGGAILPVWMTPPTDSGPGWSALLTGTGHEQNNVWWNEFVGHRLARTPDLLTRIWAANPQARTYAAASWDALVDPGGPGPVIQQRPDQQVGGQHEIFHAPDTTDGVAAADRRVTAHATWVLNHEGPDAAFVYIGGVDEAGHDHGAASPHYREATSTADEHVRRLVKAVSERYEQLGEEWLIAVTTDHGHKPEGGHGDDEVDVRRSFLVLHRVGPDGADDWARDAVAGRGPLHAEQVTPLLLDLLGVRVGSWDPAHPVGERTDIPAVGPTRDLRYEW